MSSLDKLCVSADCQTASRLSTSRISPASSHSDQKTQCSFSSNFLARAVLDARLYKTEYRRHFGETPRTGRSHCSCSNEAANRQERRPSSTPKAIVATPYKRGTIEEFVYRDIQTARSRIASAASTGWRPSTGSSGGTGSGISVSQTPRTRTASMISSLHRASSAVPLSEPPCWRAGDIDITKLRTEDEPDSNSEHYPRQAKPMILNLENLMHSTPEVIELELERMDMSELEKLDLSLEQGTSR